jgi:hypothetical protein
MIFRRPMVLVTSLALVVTMSSMTSARAAKPAASVTAAQTASQLAGSGASFFTSFEPGQPQPGYTDTVETGPDGKPRADGVEGPTPTGIGGSEMDKVTKVEANGENTGGGEIATNVADGDKFTKWLVFQPTGWLVFSMSAPVTIRKYALTSANDAAGRDPRNWTLQGSNDGTTWSTLDARTNEDFADRFQTKQYEFANETARRCHPRARPPSRGSTRARPVPTTRARGPASPASTRSGTPATRRARAAVTPGTRSPTWI